VKGLPMSMLRNCDHVVDHLGGLQPRDQAVFFDLEGEILTTLVGIETRLLTDCIFSDLVRDDVIFAADTLGEGIITVRRRRRLVGRSCIGRPILTRLARSESCPARSRRSTLKSSLLSRMSFMLLSALLPARPPRRRDGLGIDVV
jgi:hypothetical protein